MSKESSRKLLDSIIKGDKLAAIENLKNILKYKLKERLEETSDETRVG